MSNKYPIHLPFIDLYLYRLVYPAISTVFNEWFYFTVENRESSYDFKFLTKCMFTLTNYFYAYQPSIK